MLWCFRGRDKPGMVGFRKFARRILAAGGLPKEITPHVLSHSFVSLAIDLGYSEPTVVALVGHKSLSITARYTHLDIAADAAEGRGR